MLAKLEKGGIIKEVEKCFQHFPTDTVNLISAGQGDSYCSIYTPCLPPFLGGIFMAYVCPVCSKTKRMPGKCKACFDKTRVRSKVPLELLNSPERPCVDCLEVKLSSEFYGSNSMCRSCFKKRLPDNTGPRPNRYIKLSWVCTTCKVEKTRDKFKNVYSRICKECSELIYNPNIRLCYRCKERKDLSQFSKTNSLCFSCKIGRITTPLEIKKQRIKEHYQINKKMIRERVNEQRRADPESKAKSSVRMARRRARLNNAPGSFTLEEFIDLCGKYGNKCLACGSSASLTADHVVPIARGGSNDIGNIQPLCKPCNSSKSIKFIDYRQQILSEVL